MTPRKHSGAHRTGITLLEVLIALAIFLISLIGVGHLITLSGQQTLEVSERGLAAQMAQAKLAEVIAGAQPLTSQNETAFEEEPEWSWSLTAEQDETVPGLWNVEIRVSRERSDGTKYEAKLHQKVLDPSLRGSTQDAAAASTASSATSTSSQSTTSQSGATGGSSTATGTKSTTGTTTGGR